MSERLPELLCPAGSPEALDAAIDGGADAVYLGGSGFNARMNAQNFGGDALRSAVLRAHTYGVKVYLTLNTLVTDRELSAYLDAAREALQAGVDALIVADLGGAAAIHRTFPSAELHASTQMSIHHSSAGKLLQELGFSRMVVARETSREDLRELVRSSPIEIEAFIHGALCVSHSGQCLFSSLVGGRSGNRGECAQPCRLPYACPNARNAYPLSLKDLSLAAHVPELIADGIASLKIEGRMKSPEYVHETTAIWRRLLDERRAATPAEMQRLADAFSRGGFTDGYYTKRIDSSMLGIRSETDKSVSREQEPFAGLKRKIPLDVQVSILADHPIRMTLSDGERQVTVEGELPMPAQNAPLSEETAERNLTKFGSTPFTVRSYRAQLGEGLMLPLSRLNDLRRRAIAAFLEEKCPLPTPTDERPFLPLHAQTSRVASRSARFRTAAQITPSARQYFDRIYLPLAEHALGIEGVVLPPVIFDGKTEQILQMLENARQNGARYALVGNLGHIDAVRRAGLIPVGDFRLNVTNTESVLQLEALGIRELLLSPELTLPQIRDVEGNTAPIVYGRIPLMTLEKCIGREVAGCKTCRTDAVLLRDRRGVTFPVLREWEHRSLICNSLPTCMSDREESLGRAQITARHFLFTVETPDEVDEILRAHKAHLPLSIPVRRIREK